LKLIEAYGWGLSNIYKFYETAASSPEIIATQNTFKLIVPNIRRQKQKNLSEQEQRIVEYTGEKKSITSETLQELLNIKQPRASVLLKGLIEKKLIMPIRIGKSVRYVLM